VSASRLSCHQGVIDLWLSPKKQFDPKLQVLLNKSRPLEMTRMTWLKASATGILLLAKWNIVAPQRVSYARQGEGRRVSIGAKSITKEIPPAN